MLPGCGLPGDARPCRDRGHAPRRMRACDRPAAIVHHVATTLPLSAAAVCLSPLSAPLCLGLSWLCLIPCLYKGGFSPSSNAGFRAAQGQHRTWCFAARLPPPSSLITHSHPPALTSTHQQLRWQKCSKLVLSSALAPLSEGLPAFWSTSANCQRREVSPPRGLTASHVLGRPNPSPKPAERRATL